MLYSYTQEELRSICRNSIESFEVWARRIIHEKLTNTYGADYFDVDIGNNEKILNADHYKKYQHIKHSNPERCQRPVDAIFIEALIYILCKEKLYRTLFKDVLDYTYPEGREEVKEFLNRLIKPRNPLSHANPISIRQAEQILCYTNDFIDAVKQYYIRIGAEKMWNTPRFIKISDSLGNDFYPPEEHTISATFFMKNFIENHSFHVGDIYKIWVEVDSSFNDNEYEIKWRYNADRTHKKGSDNEKEFSLIFTEQQIGSDAYIECTLIQKKAWHKHKGYEHKVDIRFQVLPNT